MLTEAHGHFASQLEANTGSSQGRRLHNVDTAQRGELKQEPPVWAINLYSRGFVCMHCHMQTFTSTTALSTLSARTWTLDELML